jgi:hypothetical protein
MSARSAGVLNSFLQFLEQDGSESLVLGATNHALFRRFDAVLTLGYPTRQFSRLREEEREASRRVRRRRHGRLGPTPTPRRWSNEPITGAATLITMGRVLSKTVYDWLAAGVPAREAAERAVALFPQAIDVGVLVAGKRDAAIASNRSMAQALLEG